MPRLSLVLLCFLLGAPTALALAWGSAALVDPHRAQPSFDHHVRSDGITEVMVVHRRFGHTRINLAECAELILDDKSGNILLARWHSGGAERSETLAGWPFRAFRCTNHDDITVLIGNSSMGVNRNGAKPVPDGWLLSPFSPRSSKPAAWRAIPLRPMWFGLFADVIILGGVWLALIYGLTAWRAVQRRAHGRCPWCGYDLRSSGTAHGRCPECGRAA